MYISLTPIPLEFIWLTLKVSLDDFILSYNIPNMLGVIGIIFSHFLNLRLAINVILQSLG